MKYDALKDSGHNSDYRGKYNPLSLISNIAKAITYSAVYTVLTMGGMAGCCKNNNIAGPEPVMPKIKADVSLVDIVRYNANGDSLNNDVKFRIFSVNDGWVWYTASNYSVFRKDSSEVYGGDTTDLDLRDLPVGDFYGEVKGRNSVGKFFTITNAIPSNNQDSLSHTRDSSDRRDTTQNNNFGNLDTLRNPPGPGTVNPDTADGKQDAYW